MAKEIYQILTVSLIGINSARTINFRYPIQVYSISYSINIAFNPQNGNFLAISLIGGNFFFNNRSTSGIGTPSSQSIICQRPQNADNREYIFDLNKPINNVTAIGCSQGGIQNYNMFVNFLIGYRK